MHQRIKTYVK